MISDGLQVGDGALALASKMGFLDIAEKLVGMGCPVNEPHNVVKQQCKRFYH